MKHLRISLDKKSVQNNIVLWVVLMPCITVGLIMRLAYMIRYPIQSRDAYLYADFIDLWNTSGSIPILPNYDIPPFSIYLMRIPGFYFKIGTIESGVITNMVLGVLIIYVLTTIALNLSHNILVGLTAGLITATHPALIHFSSQLLRENSYLLFYALYISILLKYITNPKQYYIIFLGGFTIFALMCRHEGVELVIFSILVICYKTNRFHNILRTLYSLMILLISMGVSFFVVNIALGVSISYYINYIS